jgi:hypothetical protein
MVEVQCNMSSSAQPELACSEPVVVMMLQVFGNHTSISQNMAMSWLIGTSGGCGLHLGGYSHHTPVLMGWQDPPAYPEFRLSYGTHGFEAEAAGVTPLP